jgi:outer membrane protein OmpA-like peptidoglycan-associated protein/tetratricopeptide (TPR) repeat protein
MMQNRTMVEAIRKPQVIILIACIVLTPVYSQERDIPEYLQETIDKAKSYYNTSEYKRAVKYYIRVADQLPHYTWLSSRIADCYMRIDEPKDAIFWYENTLDEPEDSVDALTYLHYAEALMEVEEYTKAREALIKYNDIIVQRDLRAERYVTTMKDSGKYYSDSSYYIVEPLEINSTASDITPFRYNDVLLFSSNRQHADNEANTHYSLYYSKLLDFGAHSMPEQIEVLKLNPNSDIVAPCYDVTNNSILVTKLAASDSSNASIVDYQNDMHLISAAVSDSLPRITSTASVSINGFTSRMGHPAISQNGKTLYFSSDHGTGFGGMDIFMSKRINNQWQYPVNLGKTINTESDELLPYLHQDSVLYFSSNGHGGIGGHDIYRININNPQAGVKNLGYPINSHGDDFGFTLDPNGIKGYFSSNRNSSDHRHDLFVFEVIGINVTGTFLDEATKENLKNLTLSIVINDTARHELILADNGSFTIDVLPGASFQLEVRKNGYKSRRLNINLDMFNRNSIKSVSLGNIELDKLEQKEIKTTIVDADTVSQPVLAKTDTLEKAKQDVEAIALDTLSEQLVAQVDSAIQEEIIRETPAVTTKFRVQIAADTKPLSDNTLKRIYSGNRHIYMFHEDEWYKYAIGEFDSYYEANRVRKQSRVSGAFIAAYSDGDKLPLMNAIKTEHAEPAIQFSEAHTASLEDDATIISNFTVYFGLDDYTLHNENRNNLESAYNKLLEDSTLMVEISGHTDKQGSRAYNYGLSLERAKEIYKYYIGRGVDPDRMVIRAFGESRLAKLCNIDCTPSIHKLNRRAEVILFKSSE